MAKSLAAFDVDHVTVWRGWYASDGFDSGVKRRLAMQDRATTVDEDIHLVDLVQLGPKSKGYRPSPLVLEPQCGVSSGHSPHALQWARAGIERRGDMTTESDLVEKILANPRPN